LNFTNLRIRAVSQEIIAKENIRWAVLAYEFGEGLLVVSQDVLTVMSLQYTANNLDKDNNIYELIPREYIILCIDTKQLFWIIEVVCKKCDYTPNSLISDSESMLHQ